MRSESLDFDDAFLPDPLSYWPDRFREDCFHPKGNYKQPVYPAEYQGISFGIRQLLYKVFEFHPDTHTLPIRTYVIQVTMEDTCALHPSDQRSSRTDTESMIEAVNVNGT